MMLDGDIDYDFILCVSDSQAACQAAMHLGGIATRHAVQVWRKVDGCGLLLLQNHGISLRLFQLEPCSFDENTVGVWLLLLTTMERLPTSVAT